MGHPDGFLANIITDKAETYGFGYGVDILECGICKLFKKHNYQRYASILCEVDEITSKLAGLQLIRSGTIANGAKKCDFRYKKIE
ncbi:L-2-amino-thiazoline-4-carboxylic acid hydrolase [Haliscomenobacter sp.]|uniref:L-2-amino-thiazoline-4-carboxylic acid hydrolase n=1 Tax=Haliscomenobacter sp. TaxID=2717303 RepID=UPI003593FF61